LFFALSSEGDESIRRIFETEIFKKLEPISKGNGMREKSDYGHKILLYNSQIRREIPSF